MLKNNPPLIKAKKEAIVPVVNKPISMAVIPLNQISLMFLTVGLLL
jgi:hypothetical protein